MPDASVNYCCETNYHKIYQLKTANISYLIQSLRIRNQGVAWLSTPGFGFLIKKVQNKPGMHHLKVCRVHFQLLPCLLAGDFSAFPQDSSHTVVGSPLEQVIQERREGEPKIEGALLPYLLVKQTNPGTVWKGDRKSVV